MTKGSHDWTSKLSVRRNFQAIYFFGQLGSSFLGNWGPALPRSFFPFLFFCFVSFFFISPLFPSPLQFLPFLYAFFVFIYYIAFNYFPFFFIFRIFSVSFFICSPPICVRQIFLAPLLDFLRKLCLTPFALPPLQEIVRATVQIQNRCALLFTE